MCAELHIRDDNLWIEQARELAAIVGRENMLWGGEGDGAVPEPAGYENDDLSFCLCPVAVHETLERAGYTVINGWGEPERVDYVAFKEPAP